MFADITDKLSHREQKVKALYEPTGWCKRLLSLCCEYSDGKYVELHSMSSFIICEVHCLWYVSSHIIILH
jgi:hypothetical protein